MNYKITIGAVSAEGPFSIYTRQVGSPVFELFEEHIVKNDLIQGKIITVPFYTDQIKVINTSYGCYREKIYDVEPKGIPVSPTPTPTRTIDITPSFSSNTTPTPTATNGTPTTPVESTIKPAWLNRLSFTHDVVTHQYTLWVNATADVSLRIAAKISPQPSGLSSDSQFWNDATWLPGTTENVGIDYTELFRLNPEVSGVGGIESNKDYFVYIRRAAFPNEVYKKEFKTGTVSQTYPPVDIPLTNPNLPACSTIGRPPTISNLYLSTENQLGLIFDADNVTRFFIRIKDSLGAVVRNSEMVYFNVATPADTVAANAAVDTPTVQLFTTNSILFKYGTLTNTGTYTVEIEGSSCSSTPNSKTFTITGTVLQFTAGYPSFTRTGSTATINIKVNKSGALNTRVFNNTTNQEIYNQAFVYNTNNVLNVPNAPLGNYSITVDTLSSNLSISADNIVPKTMTSSLKEHIDIVWSGSSENWIANDVSNVTVEPGFELCYRAGGKVIRGDKLSNFKWETNNPIRIVKCIINKSYSDTYRWGKGEATDDNNAARSFTRNVSYAFVSTIFKS